MQRGHQVGGGLSVNSAFLGDGGILVLRKGLYSSNILVISSAVRPVAVLHPAIEGAGHILLFDHHLHPVHSWGPHMKTVCWHPGVMQVGAWY